MKTYVIIGVGVLLLVIGSFYLGRSSAPSPSGDLEGSLTVLDDENATSQTPVVSEDAPKSAATTQSSGAGSVSNAGSGVIPRALSSQELLKMADGKFTAGEVPLGDGKYVTSAPKKGYVYLCSARTEGGGTEVKGPWIHGTTWNFIQKANVSGNVSWGGASFTNTVSGAIRTLTSNGLPVGHTTGTFPIAKTDPVYVYDTNPNTITKQTVSLSLPLSPTYSGTPYCIGGEVGVMLTGVPIYNAFDAMLRDAPARELQDSCDGHPQKDGQYHYHNLSSCIKGTNVTRVIGYALDGFPITGPEVEPGKYLSTEDLDACHGLVSDIQIEGQTVRTYHYVMTQDFPYSVSCFRGKPVTRGPTANPVAMPKLPPQQAIDTCAGKGTGALCAFSLSEGGTVSGTCRNTPEGSFACVPN